MSNAEHLFALAGQDDRHIRCSTVQLNDRGGLAFEQSAEMSRIETRSTVGKGRLWGETRCWLEKADGATFGWFLCA